MRQDDSQTRRFLGSRRLAKAVEVPRFLFGLNHVLSSSCGKQEQELSFKSMINGLKSVMGRVKLHAVVMVGSKYSRRASVERTLRKPSMTWRRQRTRCAKDRISSSLSLILHFTRQSLRSRTRRNSLDPDACRVWHHHLLYSRAMLQVQVHQGCHQDGYEACEPQEPPWREVLSWPSMIIRFPYEHLFHWRRSCMDSLDVSKVRRSLICICLNGRKLCGCLQQNAKP